jgi:hypothetical protein
LVNSFWDALNSLTFFDFSSLGATSWAEAEAAKQMKNIKATNEVAVDMTEYLAHLMADGKWKITLFLGGLSHQFVACASCN